MCTSVISFSPNLAGNSASTNTSIGSAEQPSPAQDTPSTRPRLNHRSVFWKPPGGGSLALLDELVSTRIVRASELSVRTLTSSRPFSRVTTTSCSASGATRTPSPFADTTAFFRTPASSQM